MEHYNGKTGSRPNIRGTEPRDIFARLDSQYLNLDGPSSREVTPRGVVVANIFAPVPPTQLEQELKESLAQRVEDASPSNVSGKLKYELPKNYKGGKPCICDRPRKNYECSNCHTKFWGRLAETCEKHPSIQYLMDTNQCSKCSGPTSNIKEVDNHEK